MKDLEKKLGQNMLKMILDTSRGYPQRQLVYCWNWPLKIINLVEVSTNLKVQKKKLC